MRPGPEKELLSMRNVQAGVRIQRPLSFVFVFPRSAELPLLHEGGDDQDAWSRRADHVKPQCAVQNQLRLSQ